MSTPFETYLAKIQLDYKGGKATEHTYRSTLENLLEALERNVDASNDPKHIACGAPENVWEFHIGGYQVCDKWLKDRKGRTLSSDDIAHYQKIVVVLKETIRLMKDIDRAIPSWPIE